MLHGDQVAYYVYALDENGSALFKGSEVDFFIDGDLWDKYVDDEGKCFINVTRLDPGIGNFSVIIYNIRTNEIVTKWIDILEPTELAVNATTATYNIDKDMVISLYDINGNTLSGVNLSVDLGGVKTYTTDENGQVKINVANIVPKTYTAEITFEGNDKYAPAAANTTVTVNKAKAKIVAKNKSFKAKTKTKTYAIVLKDNKGKAIKKAKVTIKLKGKTYTAKTDSNGKATFKITGLAKKGTYKATVKFAANKYYNAVNKKVKITLK
jgi:hypothetical protein